MAKTIPRGPSPASAHSAVRRLSREEIEALYPPKEKS
jgi:hypothetical protein